MGVLLPEDPFITVNMHYHKDTGEGTGVVDDTRAGFKFYEDGDVIDYVVETNLLPHRGWTIPAGDPNFEVTNTHEVEEDIYLLSMGPHMHYRGKAMRYELSTPTVSAKCCCGFPNMTSTGGFSTSMRPPNSSRRARPCI